ncbi:MAG: hypothetical protein CL920_39220 [Deltaproteobacteria bacterium]|nr:hypothetical protein [Deltaproteobacteria bacterium]MBU54767.1 hypothetical protein [Deltaproteobacteria bacterium]|tara:strand:- start:20405 stop:22096 length:1692 start_codon:yes stop_codon:yes gene_type:complete
MNRDSFFQRERTRQGIVIGENIVKTTYLEAADILWKTGTLLKISKESSRRSTGFLKASSFVEECGDAFYTLSEEDMEDWDRVTDEAKEAVLTLQSETSFEVYDEMCERYGEGFADIVRIQGIGRVTALAIKDTLGVTDLEGLAKALKDESLLDVKGVGKRLVGILEVEIPALQEELAARAEQSARLRAEAKETSKKTTKKADKAKKVKKAATSEKESRTTPTKESKSSKKPAKKETPAEEKPVDVAARLADIVGELKDEHQQSTAEVAEEVVEEEFVAAPREEEHVPARSSSVHPSLPGVGGVLKCPESQDVGMQLLEREAVCESSHTRYPILDGVLDMMGDDASISTSPLLRLMEQPLYSQFYETIFRPQLTRVLTKRSLQKDIALSVVQLRAKPDWAILDVACGTGNYSRAIASQLDPHKGFTIGLDMSWSMLKKASQLKKRAGLNQLHFLRASAYDMPIADASMDAVHCVGAFHLMPDVDRTLREMYRVTRPGGRMVVGAFLKTQWPLLGQLQDASSPLFGLYWHDRETLLSRIEDVGFVVKQEHIDELAITITAERLEA